MCSVRDGDFIMSVTDCKELPRLQADIRGRRIQRQDRITIWRHDWQIHGKNDIRSHFRGGTRIEADAAGALRETLSTKGCDDYRHTCLRFGGGAGSSWALGQPSMWMSNREGILDQAVFWDSSA